MSQDIRTDWSRAEIAALFDLPFNDLLWQAQTVHRRRFDANAVQRSTLLSIKTGGCAENCQTKLVFGNDLRARECKQNTVRIYDL